MVAGVVAITCCACLWWFRATIIEATVSKVARKSIKGKGENASQEDKEIQIGN